MASGDNHFTDFLESQQNFTNWPINLLCTSQFEHDLESYQETLKAAGTNLFHPRNRAVYLLDYSQASKSFALSSNLTDLSQLKGSMKEDSKDIPCQYIFVHARSSRDPLSIAKEQLLYILTHHQVMPEFINHVFTFCRRGTPHLQASFSVEDKFGLYQPALKIDALGRSGLQIQHCFNLIGIEKDETRDGNWPYFIRQTATYHAFDLVGGQAVWLILKGNRLIRERIQKAAAGEKRRHRFKTAVPTPETSFSMSLSTHLLIFRWGIENCSSYIDFLQNKTQRLAAHTMLSPVAEVTKEEVIESTLPSRQNSGFSIQSRPSRSASFRARMGFSQSPPTSPVQLRTWESALTEEPDQQNPVTEIQDLNLDKLFSFDQLQALHRYAESLAEAGLVISQNRRVMKEIIIRFEELRDSETFRDHLKAEQIDFSGFFRGANACLRELDSQHDRLQIILAGLEKVMALFNGILQYKNMQTGQVFAKHANKSTTIMEKLTIKMHGIAERTKQDTISMHAITLLTLFFLPGTFVAVSFDTPYLQRLLSGALTLGQALFSTSILDFTTETPVDGIGEWTTRWAALYLFLEICLPLMTIVMGAWCLAYFRARHKAREDGWPDNEGWIKPEGKGGDPAATV